MGCGHTIRYNIYLYIHIFVSLFADGYVRVCIYICIYIYMYVYVYVYICIYVYTRICAWVGVRQVYGSYQPGLIGVDFQARRALSGALDFELELQVVSFECGCRVPRAMAKWGYSIV